jgi:hypothetical protein
MWELNSPFQRLASFGTHIVSLAVVVISRFKSDLKHDLTLLSSHLVSILANDEPYKAFWARQESSTLSMGAEVERWVISQEFRFQFIYSFAI